MRDTTLLAEIPTHLQGHRFASLPDRRRFLKTMGLGGLFFTTRGAFAQALTLTPDQTIGPYYPDHLPLDQDNDLLVINDAITPAVGEITWVSGRVLDKNGNPVRGAVLEIWQADNNGAYIHSASPRTNRDPGFQGYGRFQTSSSGEYLFRTVKPGLYPGRTRHIHFKIAPPGGTPLVTQLYVQGEALNSSDGVLNGIRDTVARSSVVVPFSAVSGSQTGELAAKFDIVLGFTPVENPAPSRPTLVSMSGVVNAATFYPGVGAGSWVTLIGDSLSSTTRSWSAIDIVDGKLPEKLDGVSVRIDGKPAPVSYVSPKQINVQAPVDAVAGSVSVTISNSSGTSDVVTVNSAAFMPAFFTLAQEYVAAVRADGISIGPAGLIDGVTTAPAKPGDQITLFGSGFGPTNPETPTGQILASPVDLANPVTILVDTRVVTVSSARLSSPGMYEFRITVPDLPDGDHSVWASISGVTTQKTVRIRIQS